MLLALRGVRKDVSTQLLHQAIRLLAGERQVSENGDIEGAEAGSEIVVEPCLL